MHNQRTRPLETARKQCLPTFSGAVLAVLGMTLAAPAADSIPKGESFVDDFDKFDWSIWGVSDGWANGSWQNCMWSQDAVDVKDGNLHLRFEEAANDKRDYICGEIQTRRVYGYGTYEARVRAEPGSGLNAAFFTYIGEHHGKPHDEIDVEILTRDTSAVSLNTYVDGEPHNGERVNLPIDADAGFITYAFVWSEEGITWYVDGLETHRTGADTPLPTPGQKIYASLWGSDSFPNWMGRFDKPEGTKTMTVDWIAFTAEGESCQFPESLACKLE